MNKVIDYIEKNIIDDIDYSILARIACCPTNQFSRIFSFLANMTLSDYIRRRRLTLAALEIQQKNVSILEIALKYGYESNASFTRAFQEHHKISPSSARNENAILNIFPCMHFNKSAETNENLTYRIEKGKIKVAKIINIDFVPFGPYKIIGKSIRTKPMTQDIPVLWSKCFSDKTFDILTNMKDYCPEETPDSYQGYMRDFSNDDGVFTYLAGFFMKPDTPVPNGFDSYMIPACIIARAWIEGEEYDIYTNSHNLTVNAVNENGYAVDWNNFFQCEVYTDARFGIPKSKGEKVLILDFYIPCVKKINFKSEQKK